MFVQPAGKLAELQTEPYRSGRKSHVEFSDSIALAVFIYVYELLPYTHINRTLDMPNLVCLNTACVVAP